MKKYIPVWDKKITYINLIEDMCCYDGLIWYAKNSENGKWRDVKIIKMLVAENCQEGLDWLERFGYIKEIEPVFPKEGELWSFKQNNNKTVEVLIIYSRLKEKISFVSNLGETWNGVHFKTLEKDFKYLGKCDGFVRYSK